MSDNGPNSDSKKQSYSTDGGIFRLRVCEHAHGEAGEINEAFEHDHSGVRMSDPEPNPERDEAWKPYSSAVEAEMMAKTVNYKPKDNDTADQEANTFSNPLSHS